MKEKKRMKVENECKCEGQMVFKEWRKMVSREDKVAKLYW